MKNCKKVLSEESGSSKTLLQKYPLAVKMQRKTTTNTGGEAARWLLPGELISHKKETSKIFLRQK